MINKGKHPILGVRISAVDYEYAVHRMMEAAEKQDPLAVSALAVHGVMTGYMDIVHRRRLNGLDLVVPDGQPVRWGLRWRHGVHLPDRVYGPELTLKVAEAAAKKQIPIYLYGSTEKTLSRFAANLESKFPGLTIVGKEPSKFRKLEPHEKREVVDRIKKSGARIVLVGLGCPRQEVWVYEYRNLLNMPLLAVGAAFDFHAGLLKQAPPWMQKRGLEWLYRLIQEPKRLWKRYMVLNPLYVLNLLGEILKVRKIPVEMPTWKEKEESFG
ncbi:exopolysaccharide biosynthesis WecB/TagA/CpsF family protein [Melghirimyces profundicolus]|uniref:Exopolysaccharide biosynthesis WecB/TagA/CpsF family protein n=1 Tax=Melghirimyces profundicolus TaxID=1242148 RepID=A0A2T6BCI0_9BACL|nr:WecB/TagA/CpsF family glycosyltransferase [Melghirimyces profundicolus]PTX53736.1 exopolysaccharide biosynthesis WecB/TagA/CpsF family protein [Melghirimyces profundicolus]